MNQSVVGILALTVCSVSAYILKKHALIREINEISQRRNQWMCQEIDKHSKVCRGKIFVLAGRHHFPGGAKKEDPDDYELTEKTVRCIRNWLGGNDLRQIRLSGCCFRSPENPLASLSIGRSLLASCAWRRWDGERFKGAQSPTDQGDCHYLDRHNPVMCNL